MSSGRPIRIGLLSPQSNRNLGDTATFAAAIAAYRCRLGDVELITVVPEPVETARLFGTEGFPLYGDGPYVPATTVLTESAKLSSQRTLPGRLRSMRRVHEFVRAVDAIVFTGGGQLDDFWGGAWNLPFWVLTWAAAARLHGVNVVFHAIGYDRLTSRASRLLALWALRLAHYRSFRDAESLQVMRALGLSGQCDVVPDLAFALEWAHAETFPADRLERPYVILNPASERMWTHRHDEPSYAPYLGAFVTLGRHLMQRGLAVKLLSTQDQMDSDALNHIETALGRSGEAALERVHCKRLDEFMTLANHATLVVSSRLHGLILAWVAGTPAVSVSPMRKMARLMADGGFSDFNLDVDKLQSDALIKVVDQALAEAPRLRQQIARLVVQYRTQLASNIDRLIASGHLGARAQSHFFHEGEFKPRSQQ
jgi:polysaccharide pyruvyl transferase WcaK-like protein